MAKSDVPEGFVYDARTRGAFNPATGQRLSRRDLDLERIRRELGQPELPKGRIYEEKAAQRAQLAYRLPPRLPVKNGIARYRLRTLVEVFRVLDALHPTAQVYVRVYGRNPNPSNRNSPKFVKRGRISKRKYAIRPDRLRWITPTRGMFLAGNALRYEPEMIDRLSNMYDIRAFDVVVVREG